MELSKLQLFLLFIKADRRCSPQFMEEPKRKGIPGRKLDFPLFRYTISLESRLRMLTILRNNIHNLNKDTIEETEKLHEKIHHPTFRPNERHKGGELEIPPKL